jgi:hypothetical protein
MRGALVKLGCISLTTGLLEGKALSVMQLLKPYRLKVCRPCVGVRLWCTVCGVWMCAPVVLRASGCVAQR